MFWVGWGCIGIPMDVWRGWDRAGSASGWAGAGVVAGENGRAVWASNGFLDVGDY